MKEAAKTCTRLQVRKGEHKGRLKTYEEGGEPVTRRFDMGTRQGHVSKGDTGGQSGPVKGYIAAVGGQERIGEKTEKS